VPKDGKGEIRSGANTGAGCAATERFGAQLLRAHLIGPE